MHKECLVRKAPQVLPVRRGLRALQDRWAKQDLQVPRAMLA